MQAVLARVVTFLSYAILLLGISTILMTAFLVVISYSPMPFFDQWMFVDRLAQNKGPISVSLLWAQHNEHRIFFPELFDLADLYLAGGRNILLLVSIFLVQLCHWGVWGYIFRRFAGLSGAAWRTAFGIAAFCFFIASQIENFVWGFQIAFVLPGLAATLALTALLLHEEKVRRSAEKPVSSDYLLLALSAAVLGSYSLASGVLIWPLLLLGGFLFRLPLRTILLVAIAGAAAIALFFWGYTSHSTPGPLLRSQWLEGPKFILTYFGVSLRYISLPLGMWLAAIVIVVIMALSVRLLLRKDQTTLFLFLPLGIILFCCGTAAMTAVGRTLGDFPSRYQTIAMLFWLCAAAIAILWLWKPDAEDRRDHFGVVFFQASVILIIAFVGIRLSQLRDKMTERRQTLESATLALVTGVPDISLASVIVPDRYFASGHFDVSTDLQFLQKIHAWVYADKFYLSMGHSFDHVYSTAPKEQCSGALEFVRPIAGDVQRGSRITGWAWDTVRNHPVSKIVVVTPDGLIAGLARGDGYGLPFQTAIPHPSRAIWRGFLQSLPRPAAIRAYAIVADGQACPLQMGDGVPSEFAGKSSDSVEPPSSSSH